jgi:hypothetical protein
MYQFPEIKNFQGLFLQQNSFTVPDGYLEEAANAVVSKDGILTKRRGYYQYYDPNSGTLNKLFNYQNKLLASYENAMAYYTDTGSSPNETGTQTTLTGETVAITSPRVSRGLQANENLYFTTDNGPLKLTAYNSTISPTGAPPGLDLSAKFINGAQATWFEGGNIVGYRVVFGYKDANANLILGAPSDIATIVNTQVTGVSATVSGGGPYTITVSSTAHGLSSGQYLNFTNAAGFTTSANADGIYQITVLSANSFSYSVVNNPTGSGTLDYCYAMPVRLEFSVPSEVTTALPWFYQIYRSSQQEESVGIFSDFKLLDEQNLTSAEISAKVVFFTDDLDDVLLGAELYTNENSREGELQANYRPPLCNDVALYKGYSIYANCTSRQLIALSVVDPTSMVNNDYIEFKISATTRRYVARTGVGNRTVRGTCSSSSGLLITYVSHGLVNGDTIYIANIVGGTLTAGTYYVISATTNDFKISLSSGGSAISYNGETSLDFEGVTNGTYYIFYLSESTTASVRLRDTAQAIVKAVNRDPQSLIYGQYVSGINDVPGKMRFQAKGFGAAIYIRANTTTAGQAFSPNLPGSFSVGTQVYSTNDTLPNAIFISKFNEPEAVPLVNFLTVGSKNKPIIRIHALRDSLIVLKEDGAFTMTGDNINNFSITLLDGTVSIVAASSSDVLNNQVVFLSNQGVCLVTESSVQIISRTIEDVIQPILGQPNLSMETSGVSYESERLYMLTTTTPNDPTASQVYVYNFLTNAWTTWDTLFSQGVIGPNDVLYMINVFNSIDKERKKQTKIDYTGQNFTVTISNLSLDLTSCDITLPSGVVPEIGDIIVKDNVINRIDSVPVFLTGDTYSVEFLLPSNLENSDSVDLYSKITTSLRFAPFHAGLVGRMKLFSQMQIHLRENSISKMLITFRGDTYGTSEETNWRSLLINQGWGYFPWGYEAWGQTETINLTQGTRPAPMIRTYIPKLQARVTFIQPMLEHAEAAEPMNIQSLSYAVRAYGERVSR